MVSYYQPVTDWYKYNTQLLELLFNVQTEKIPGLEYWITLQRNQDFINFSYFALKKANDPNAKQLIPRMVAVHHKNYGKDPRRDVAFGPNYYLFELLKKEFWDAYSQFLDDPSNEYRTTIRAITDTPLEAPEVITFIEGNILLLSSYKPVNGMAEIRVVYINDKIQEYTLRTNPKNPEFGKEIPSELHNHLGVMVKGFDTFRIGYLTHIATVKAKK